MTEVDLKHPVEVNGQTYSSLNIRAPKVRDMLASEKIGKSDAEREATLFANLCEVDRPVIEELHMVDYAKLQKAFQDFLS